MRIPLIFLLSAAFVSTSYSSDVGIIQSFDDSIKKLQSGNKRYIDESLGSCKKSDAPRRLDIAKGQHPFAIVLSCSDSRVPPELIFDQGLGDLFVVRVAGNTVDPVILGSIEYAAEHLGAGLIVVLGHERCGAVTAAYDGGSSDMGNIDSIVRRIAPAVKNVKARALGKERLQMIEDAIDENVNLVADEILKQSKVLKHLVEEKKVKIVKAKYDLDDGKVNFQGE